MVLNFSYALFGGLMTLGMMVLGFKSLDRLTVFNTSEELKNGNQAVGLTVAGIFIGIGFAVGLVIGMSVN